MVKNCIFSCNASTSYTGEVTTMYPDEDVGFISENDYPYDDVSGDGYPLPELDSIVRFSPL